MRCSTARAAAPWCSTRSWAQGPRLLLAKQLADAYGMELDPRYVDVAIRRWQQFTGRDAILDGDGRTFTEIEAARSAPVAESDTPQPRRRRQKGAL